MKIGVITDIHNNAVALNLILSVIQREQCDGIICCGDMIGIGPYPEETVSAIMNIPNLLACVLGNHERYLVEGIPAEIDVAETAHHKWEHGCLSDKTKQFIRSLKYDEYLTINNIRIYVAHYAMNQDKCYVDIRNSSVDNVNKMFETVDADIILYGHEHERSVLHGDKYFIDVGSLGCPGGDRNIARAGILSIEEEVFFDEIEVEYDVSQVIAEIDRLDYPAKEEIKRFFYGV